MQELFCNTENNCGDGWESTDTGHTSRARIWPFGDGYISQLAPLYGKPDKRGQHMAGNGKPVTVVQNGKAAHQHRARDTSKFAPKHPKAGKPPPGNRAPKGAA